MKAKGWLGDRGRSRIVLERGKEGITWGNENLPYSSNFYTRKLYPFCSSFVHLFNGVYLFAVASKTTGDVIQKALKTVSTKTVLTWCTENFGQSVQAKRKGAFVSR